MKSTREVLDGLFYSKTPPMSRDNLLEARPANLSEEFVDYYLKRQLYTQMLYTPSDADKRRFLKAVTTDRGRFEADITFYTELKRYNDGYTSILTLVRQFDRELFAFPLKTKKASELAQVSRETLQSAGVKKLLIDGGSEFKGDLGKLLRKLDIQVTVIQPSSSSFTRLAITNGIHSHLRKQLQLAMKTYNTNRWIELLPRIVQEFNDRRKKPDMQKVIAQRQENELKLYKYAPNSYVRTLVFARSTKNRFKKGSRRWSATVHQILERVGSRFRLRGKDKLYAHWELKVIQSKYLPAWRPPTTGKRTSGRTIRNRRTFARRQALAAPPEAEVTEAGDIVQKNRLRPASPARKRRTPSRFQ